MDFADEHYVRLYPRRTLTKRRLGWEGRAVMHEMLGEFERAGVFAIAGDPAECIALVTELPLDVVRLGLERLIATGTWLVTESAVVWPTFDEAQTCAKNDKQRQRASRAKRAALAAGGKRSRRNTPSHAVTIGHAPSRAVTPSLALAQQNLSPPNPHGGEKNDELDEPEPEVEGELVAEPAELDELAEPFELPLGAEPQATPALHYGFPLGWRWSLETTAEAVAQGVTAAELQRHVNYWTTRNWAIGVTDLDLELRLAIEGIKERRAKNGTPPPPAVEPLPETLDYARRHELGDAIVAAIVAGVIGDGVAGKHGVERAREAIACRMRVAAWQKRIGHPATGKLTEAEAAERARARMVPADELKRRQEAAAAALRTVLGKAVGA